ncbi:MAG TPA: carboxypeptidase-like regulatory domain-containing protein [Flavipsychrobacter sp.]|nr:carboxypeptidase-like regulatory domain-containing protein [Flavipsychrobacter sp.]
MNKLLIAACFLIVHTAYGQKGQISGNVANEMFQPVKSVKILVYKGAKLTLSAKTDSTGLYTTRKFDAGTYKVVFSYPNYRNTIVTDVTVVNDSISPLTVVIYPKKPGYGAFEKPYAFFNMAAMIKSADEKEHQGN